jgi:hypothetical protein
LHAEVLLDTEFIASGERLDLISVALVADSAKEFYAISTAFDEANCSDWVKQHVLQHLPSRAISAIVTPAPGLWSWETRTAQARPRHVVPAGWQRPSPWSVSRQVRLASQPPVQHS